MGYESQTVPFLSRMGLLSPPPTILPVPATRAYDDETYVATISLSHVEVYHIASRSRLGDNPHPQLRRPSCSPRPSATGAA